MLKDKKQKETEQLFMGVVLFIEAVFHGFIGWVLLARHHSIGYAILAAYSIGIAGAMTMAQFLKERK